MDSNDVRKIAEIMMTADGGCGTCAGDLLHRFNVEFPGFEDVLDEVWSKEYDSMVWRDD